MPLESNINIKDHRPKSQKTSGYMSLLISNCKYGSYQIGDKDIQPDRISMLKYELSSRLPVLSLSDEIIVKNYTIHINGAKGLRGSMAGMYPGLLNDMMNDVKVVGCSEDDLFGGYAENEVTKYSDGPIIVVIDVEIAGKNHHARWVENHPVKPALLGTKEWNVFVSNAIETATKMLIEQVIKSSGHNLFKRE